MKARHAIFLLVISFVFVLALVSGPARSADDPGDLDRYVGRYSSYSGSQSVIEVTHEGGTLFFQPAGQGKFPSTLKENGAFQLDNTPLEVVFAENDEGDIESLGYTQGGGPCI